MVKIRVIKLRRVEGQKAHDQIAFCAFHSFLVEVQMNAGYIRCMCNNNLDIRIAGSSCRRNKIHVRKKHKRILNVRKQLKKREKNKYVLVKFHFWLTSFKDLNFPWLEVRFPMYFPLPWLFPDLCQPWYDYSYLGN